MGICASPSAVADKRDRFLLNTFQTMFFVKCPGQGLNISCFYQAASVLGIDMWV